MHKKETLIVVISFIVSYLLYVILDIGCPLNKLFGIDCAGCGVTRMFLAILRLDFYQAFRFNPFVFLIIICILIYLVYVLISILFKRKYFKVGIKTFIIVIILFIGFGILRNVSGFEFLKPTIVR